MNPVARITQRYLMLGPLRTAYFYLGCRAFVAPKAQVQATRLIRFGRGSVVKAYAVINTTGGRILFGHNCAVSCFNHIGTGKADVMIGDNVRLGPHVGLTGTARNFRRRDQRIIDQGYTDSGLRIGSDVLVGSGAQILAGVEVGDGAVIGAGAIVIHDVPPYCIVAGVPAKVVGERK